MNGGIERCPTVCPSNIGQILLHFLCCLRAIFVAHTSSGRVSTINLNQTKDDASDGKISQRKQRTLSVDDELWALDGIDGFGCASKNALHTPPS